jgi:phage protein D/phage baseplate assembly protein gpV
VTASITRVPTVKVEVDGAPLEQRVAGSLTAVRVRQRLAAPAQCELTFHTELEDSLPELGSQLTVHVDDQDGTLFAGQLTAVEHHFEGSGDHTIVLRAYDPLHRLRKRQEPRALVQTTVAALADELAAEIGLSSDRTEDGPTWQNVLQHRESDLELLVRLAARCGLYPIVGDGNLRLITLAGYGDAVELHYGTTLLAATVELNGERAARRVTAAGWDPLAATNFEASTSAARVGRQTRAEVTPGAVGGSEDYFLFGEYASDRDHAEGLAQAELDVRAAGEVTLTGIAEGDTRLAAGAPIEISALSDNLDGRYVLTETVHTLNAVHGYLTELSTRPPTIRPRASASAAALGEVTSVDDPDERGRVRVKFPAYDNLESDWLGVVAAGAGSGRGVVALPNVGDHVLVVFAHEDAATGIVIGGLYGTGRPPDPGVVNAAVRRFSIHTSDGQQVVLDDDKHRLRLQDRTGSWIELSPDGLIVHAAVDLTLEAPGKTLTVRADAVEFEQQ